MSLEPKLGQGICAIWGIMCVFVDFTSMLDKTWSPVVSHNYQPWYKPFLDSTYWPMLGYFNNWNIIEFNNKGTSSEDFDYVNKIFLDGISDCVNRY